jgi:hypothetical protein
MSDLKKTKNLPPVATTLLHIGWNLDLLWCLDVAPKAFGVGAFATSPSILPLRLPHPAASVAVTQPP